MLSDEEIDRLELRPRIRYAQGILGVQWTQEEALALLTDLRSLRERVEKAEAAISALLCWELCEHVARGEDRDDCQRHRTRAVDAWRAISPPGDRGRHR